jgi:thiol-disulfide isomerase/thioredoxin
MQRRPLWPLLTFALLSGCGRPPQQPISLIPPEQRVPAIDIGAQFLNSNDLSLDELRGNVVILDFWATWCGPCRMEIPTFIQLYNDYHSKGLEIIGLSVEGGEGKSGSFFAKFISDNGMNYPVGLSSMDTIKNYGATEYPTTFFIDKQGRIALSFLGVHPEDDFNLCVQQLLAEPGPAPNRPRPSKGRRTKVNRS